MILDKLKAYGWMAAAIVAGGLLLVQTGRLYSEQKAHGDLKTAVAQAGEERAESIYIRNYVAGPGFEPVIAASPAVGEKLVDIGVNAGTGRSARWFQQALNHLSRGGADFPLVAVDGQIGAQTLAAYRALEGKRGRVKACELVIKLLDAQQGTHYMSLNQPTFIVGWADARLGNVPLARCADSVQEPTS